MIKIDYSGEPSDYTSYFRREYMKKNNDALDAVTYSTPDIVGMTAENLSRLWEESLFKENIRGIYDTKDLPIAELNLPDRVFYNEKKGATTLLYGDNATVVKTTKGDKYDREKGFLLAFFQKHSGLTKTQANKYLKDIIKDKE